MNVIGDTKFPIKLWTDGVPVEEQAEQQLRNIAGMPFIHRHVAVMPDVHLGKGATVGSVIPTRGAIIPAAVGVDIGCGMNAVRLSLKAHQLPDNLRQIRSQVERDVPVGFAVHENVSNTQIASRLWNSRPLFLRDLDFTWQRAPLQLGTLGGGNHFIELCLDENDDVWIMLHSGSRGIGNQIGRHYIAEARKLMEQFFIELPDKDLAFLVTGTSLFDEYIEAVEWAQEYAFENRRIMMDLVITALTRYLPQFTITQEAINCHHNYIEQENHYGQNVYVTRKGAIRAREGDLGIIPGSMGAKSFIVRGKGNEESFCSCSHGAGRVSSRTAARRLYSEADLEEATKGVECRKDEGVIDEIPLAYKDIDAVMAAQSDLVEIVHTLKQVMCVKG